MRRTERLEYRFEFFIFFLFFFGCSPMEGWSGPMGDRVGRHDDEDDEYEDTAVTVVAWETATNHPFDFLVVHWDEEPEGGRQSFVHAWVRRVYRERGQLLGMFSGKWWIHLAPDGLLLEVLDGVMSRRRESVEFVPATIRTEDRVAVDSVSLGRRLAISDRGSCKRFATCCVRRRQEQEQEQEAEALFSPKAPAECATRRVTWSVCWCGLQVPLLWGHFILLRAELSAFFLLSLFETLSEGSTLHRDVLLGAIGALRLVQVRARDVRRVWDGDP